MRTQVAIVGGGPVGLGLAIELGQRDIATVVIEKSESVHRIPKGQNLTQRTMEHFRSWRVEDEVRAARLMPPGYPAVGVNAYGDLVSRWAHPWFRRSQVGQYYFAANERLPQYLTEQVLRDRVESLAAVTTLYGSQATSIAQDPDVAWVTTDQGWIEARYVVGCDGSHSIVRRQAGIGEERSPHDKRMVLLVFRSRELHQLLEDRFGPASFFNVLDPALDGYWRFLGRVDVGESWFFHAPVAADVDETSIDSARLLYDTVGARFRLEVDYTGFWDLRIAIADAYQRGRVFIAGDAAHSHPPYGGYGINTGLEDARNLGWKLAAVIQGWGGEALLDSYTEERRPVFVSTAQDFIEAFIANDRAFIAEYHPEEDEGAFTEAWDQRRAGTHGVSDFEPHYEGSPIVWGPAGSRSGAVGSHTFQARAGHHLPPPGPSPGRDLFEVLGPGLTLITSGRRASVAAEFTSAARSLGIPFTVVGDRSDGEMADYEATMILVRPDHYISWAGASPPTGPAGLVAGAVAR